MKKICSHWKTIRECQITQPCNRLQNILCLELGRGRGGQEEGVREGKGEKMKREEKQM